VNPIDSKGKAKNDDDFEEGDELILDYDMSSFIQKAKRKA
jgi:hypothetical protein